MDMTTIFIQSHFCVTLAECICLLLIIIVLYR